MYTDAQNRPSNGQAITTGTQLSTDSIDLIAAARNIGRTGQPMRAVVHVTTAFAGGTSLKAQLVESANSNLSSPTVLAEGPVVVEADLIAGAKLLDVPLPNTTKRYLGIQYVTVGTHASGNVSAHIVAGTDRSAGDIPMNTGL